MGAFLPGLLPAAGDQSGSKIKTMATRRRRAAEAAREVVLPSDDVVIDLTSAQPDSSATADSESASSQALYAGLGRA